MTWNDRIRAALLKAGHDPDEDVVEELAQHARAMYDSARADGASEDAARHRVDLQVALWAGDASLLRRPAHGRAAPAAAVDPPTRPADRPARLAGLMQDVRYAIRVARLQPAFALLVAGTIALGIGASAALFSVAYGVLMKPLPWPNAAEVVLLEETRGGNRPRFGAMSNAAYLAWRDAPETIDGIGAWSSQMATIGGVGDPERLRIAYVSASLFRVLGARPLLGTLFDEPDEQNTVVVLAEGWWKLRLGGDPSVVGRIIQIDGTPHTVVGILPDRFAYPDPEARAWVPFRVPATSGNLLSMFSAIAKLKPGVTPAQAAAEGTSRGRYAPDTNMTTRAIFGGNGPIEISARPLRDAWTSAVRTPLLVLLAAVLLLFVAATANIASVQLARAAARRREMAIRAALGANARRLARQLIVENVLLGFIGGLAGLVAAWLLLRALPSLLPADFPRVHDIGIDLAVVAAALGASVAASVAIGLLPARRARRINLVDSLAEEGTSPSGGSVRTSMARTRALILTGQVAVACVLLVGASLLGRSFLALIRADVGFDPRNVLTARLQMPGFAYPPERRAAIVDAVVGRLRAIPGVVATSYADGPPLGIFGGTSFFIGDRQVNASSRTVTPGYFAAMGMRIVAGRDFTDEDVATSRPAVIVNRAFARQYLPESPAGTFVRGWVRKAAPQWEILGVVEDVRHRGPTEPAEPEIYLYREKDTRRISAAPTVIVRTAGDPLALATTLRAIVRAQDAAVVVDSVMTMEERLMMGLARPRLYAMLLAGFAGLALLIASVGLFGLLSFTVAQRSRELALRTALGATRADILRLVMLYGVGVAAVGIAVGLVASVALRASVSALLHGVTPADPLTYVVVPTLLLAVAVAACALPAWRAARLDPLRVLKGA